MIIVFSIKDGIIINLVSWVPVKRILIENGTNDQQRRQVDTICIRTHVGLFSETANKYRNKYIYMNGGRLKEKLYASCREISMKMQLGIK